ncbi:Ku protein [Streptomyces sp. NPDC017095]|uniref:Ku protein n=1 Tax=Streptomyces sp. NPDC017095 TaxID=3364977 RepID=UPI0037B0D846
MEPVEQTGTRRRGCRRPPATAADTSPTGLPTRPAGPSASTPARKPPWRRTSAAAPTGRSPSPSPGRASPRRCSHLPLSTAKAIGIDAFVPLESVDPVRIGKGYYLQPASPVAAKPYKLLVKALSRSSKVAVAKYAWSGRERLGLLRVRDDVRSCRPCAGPTRSVTPARCCPVDRGVRGAARSR